MATWPDPATVLVTGATGLLGSALLPLLAARGHRVVGHGRRAGAAHRADLCDAPAVAAMVAEYHPDCIVNLAALTDVDACERAPHQAYLHNVLSVENLAAAIAGSACHLVQISTDQLYDGPGPHAERDITVCNTYAFSKRAAELAAARVGATVLRTNFFGRSQCAGRSSFSDWLVQGLRSGAGLNVFEDVQFSPLSIDTLCDMIERVLRQRPQGVFNLGARGGMSKADFAFALGDALGLSTAHLRRTDSGALATYRPKDMCMDSSHFEHTMGLQLPGLADEILSLRSAYRETA